MASADGREFGKSWEEIIERRARSNGLLALKSGYKAVFGKGGFINVVKSDLDFKLFTREGRIACIDAKTFGSPHFTYNELLQKKEPRTHQIDLAILYQDWGINAGFLVWFRPVDEVCFFSGRHIAKIGPGSRFGALDGIRLGNIQSFDLRPILAAST